MNLDVLVQSPRFQIDTSRFLFGVIYAPTHETQLINCQWEDRGVHGEANCKLYGEARVPRIRKWSRWNRISNCWLSVSQAYFYLKTDRHRSTQCWLKSRNEMAVGWALYSKTRATQQVVGLWAYHLFFPSFTLAAFLRLWTKCSPIEWLIICWLFGHSLWLHSKTLSSAIRSPRLNFIYEKATTGWEGGTRFNNKQPHDRLKSIISIKNNL